MAKGRPQQLSRSGVPKDLHPLFLKATEQGWRVIKTPGGHIKWLGPDGTTVVISHGSRDSDARGVINTQVRLKRAGLRV